VSSLPIYRLTVRALLLQRRTLGLALLTAAPVLMALVFALAADAGADHRRFYSRMVQDLFVPIVTALIGLIVGVSAIGDEREDGTILYLAATPLPRLGIVLAKIAAAWTVCVAVLVPSLVVSGLLALGSEASVGLIGWPLLGVALAALAYCSVSAWLSLRVRRPIVVGVVYILLWEGSIATYAASADRLSIAAYGRALVAERLPQASAAVVSPGIALVVLIACAAVATLLGARAMSRTELP
jgi:ABC-2 type transport system permease protein